MTVGDITKEVRVNRRKHLKTELWEYSITERLGRWKGNGQKSDQKRRGENRRMCCCGSQLKNVFQGREVTGSNITDMPS